ncbi:MAG: hypothetical protein IJY28_08250 [Clostridia bacterium]|nr:hypothetical protein [Clostridia bacterium]
MFRKHEFLDLNLGLVKENFAVVSRKDRKLWEARGFTKIRKYPLFDYRPSLSEIVMLGMPLNIEQFGAANFAGSRITDLCPFCGTYGMGGPGFFGIKLEGNFGVRWLTYCIWSAGEHLLLDGRVLECHPRYSSQYQPLLSPDDYSGSLQSLKEAVTGMTIESIRVSADTFELRCIDANAHVHTLQSYKFSDAFPERSGTGQKRPSFTTGEMKDWWLVTYDETHLMV